MYSRILPLILLLVLSGCGKNLSDMSQHVEAQQIIPPATPQSPISLNSVHQMINENTSEIYGMLDQSVKSNASPTFSAIDISTGSVKAAGEEVTKPWKEGLEYTVDTSVIEDGVHYICVTPHLSELSNKPPGVNWIDPRITSYNDLTDKPEFNTAATRAVEDVLTDSTNIPSSQAVVDWVGNSILGAENVWTRSQNFYEGITVPHVTTTAPDGYIYGNFLNTIAYIPAPTQGDCQYSTFLTPVGWHCYDGAEWIYQGSQGYTDLETDYDVLAPVETFLKTGTRATLETAIGGPLGMTTFMDLTDRPLTISLAQLERLAGSTQNIQQQIQNLQDQIDAINTAPSAPTLTGATIGTTGNVITLTSNSLLTVGAGSSVFDVDCSLSGTNITATLSNGLGTNSLTYTLGSTVQTLDTCNLDHVQSGNGVEKVSDGSDLASFTDMEVTNQSLYAAGGTEGTIFYLDFEGTQSEDLAGWEILQPAGVLTADSTSFGVLSGTQSFRALNNASGLNGILSPTFAPQSVLYYKLLMRSGNTGASFPHGIRFYSNGNPVGQTNHGVGYRLTHGSTEMQTVYPISNEATYYMCGKYTAGTGSNGQHILNIGTNADSSLNTTHTVNGGNGVGTVDRVGLVQYASNPILLDDFTLSTSAIPGCSL